MHAKQGRWELLPSSPRAGSAARKPCSCFCSFCFFTNLGKEAVKGQHTMWVALLLLLAWGGPPAAQARALLQESSCNRTAAEWNYDVCSIATGKTTA